MGEKKKIVVAISGASGAIYGIRLLEALKATGSIETHLVISGWGAQTIETETKYTVADVKALADVVYENNDLGAAIASGSFCHDGMVVVPCSMKTVAALSCAYSDTLIARAADVCLKERFSLILVPRESPLHSIHLQNLLTLSNAGAVILPPMPVFYTKPETLDDIINSTVGRILQMLRIENELVSVWKGMNQN